MTAATKIVVPEDFTYVDRSFQYAAAWREVRIQAGEYSLDYVTISYTKPYAPVHHDGGPYYAVAKLPCETVAAQHANDVTAHSFCTYQYNAVSGEPAMTVWEGVHPVIKAVFA